MAEKVLDFPIDRDRRSPGDGLLLKGKRCPLRSPRPDKGVRTRLISRACSVGGGIKIGSSEVLVVANTVESVDLLNSVVGSFGSK